MKATSCIVTCLFTVLVAGAAAAAPAAPARTPGDSAAVLSRFVEDYRDDPSIVSPQLFGVRVDGEAFTVSARPGSNGGHAAVEIAPGVPTAPTFEFVLDRETLDKLDARQWNGLTAGARAFESEKTPLDIEPVNGWKGDAAGMGQALSIWFHFWTRGLPEIVPFGPELTRATHGAQATVLYYQEGFRSAWVSLEPGQHANADPRSQANPFPTLLVILSGRGFGRIGGREVLLSAGEAVLVPAETPHEFWNPFGERMTALLLMFGDGA